jgi:hypothetical protein
LIDGRELSTESTMLAVHAAGSMKLTCCRYSRRSL